MIGLSTYSTPQGKEMQQTQHLQHSRRSIQHAALYAEPETETEREIKQHSTEEEHEAPAEYSIWHSDLHADSEQTARQGGRQTEHSTME